MNICLVTPAYRTEKLVDSGLATHFVNLAEGLTQLGHTVHVLCVTHAEAIERSHSYIENGIHVHIVKFQLPTWLQQLLKSRWALQLVALKLGGVFQTRQALIRLHQTYQFDIIEATSYDSLCLAYLLVKQRPPIVTRVSTTATQIIHNYHLYSRALQALPWLEQQVTLRSDYLVTHAIAHRDVACQELNLDPQRFTIIPHGIQLPPVTDVNSSNRVDGTVRILYVGRFESRKGIDLVMQAIPIVLSQFPEVEFQLVGEDTDQYYENSLKQQLGFDSQRVIFFGKVEQDKLAHLYRACDLFIAPSRYESFGLIYVEAMSFGKPVIGCRVGGVPEVIKDTVTGFLIPPDNVDALVSKINQLIADPELRYTMGLVARQHVEQSFSQQAMAQKSAQYYSQILQRSQSTIAASI